MPRLVPYIIVIRPDIVHKGGSHRVRWRRRGRVRVCTRVPTRDDNYILCPRGRSASRDKMQRLCVVCPVRDSSHSHTRGAGG